MLQQTQASRVQEKLPPFLRRFRSLRSLGGASTADVVRAWRGLGYNNRAVRLRDSARTILERHRGIIPRTVDELLRLPGIGKYTAHALCCFAYGKRVPVADVNVRRVLSRIFWKVRDFEDLKPWEDIWPLAERILPRDAYAWNQSLMELGATVCTARRPQCDSCPVTGQCSSSGLRARSLRVMPPASRSRREPMYQGKPRREWRGRIVEILRNGRGPLPLRSVGRLIKHDFSPDEVPWLATLLEALRRDGILRKSGEGRVMQVELARE